MKSYFSINIYIACIHHLFIYINKQQYGINSIMLESERDRHFNILQSDHVYRKAWFNQSILLSKVFIKALNSYHLSSVNITNNNNNKQEVWSQETTCKTSNLLLVLLYSLQLSLSLFYNLVIISIDWLYCSYILYILFVMIYLYQNNYNHKLRAIILSLSLLRTLNQNKFLYSK